MKKFLLPACACGLALFLSFCGGSKKTATPPPPPETPVAKITFEGNVKPIIVAKCGPCHTPGRGQLPSYLTSEITKRDIEDILHRIQLQPTERGFMPVKGQRLSDSAINVFKQWKTDGFVEK